MFALAIWDDRRQELFLARDRFGKKPLYYLPEDDRLLFASEIKAILRVPGVERTPDLEVIHDYLGLGYCTGERTAFRGIFRLPPGSAMVLKADGQRKIWRYWQLPEIDPSLAERPVDELLEEFMALARRDRQVMDVLSSLFGVSSRSFLARKAI